MKEWEQEVIYLGTDPVMKLFFSNIPHNLVCYLHRMSQIEIISQDFIRHLLNLLHVIVVQEKGLVFFVKHHTQDK